MVDIVKQVIALDADDMYNVLCVLYIVLMINSLFFLDVGIIVKTFFFF